MKGLDAQADAIHSVPLELLQTFKGGISGMDLHADFDLLGTVSVRERDDLTDQFGGHAGGTPAKIQRLYGWDFFLREVAPQFSLQRFRIGLIAGLSEDHFVVRAMGTDTATKGKMDIEMRAGVTRKCFSLLHVLENKGIAFFYAWLTCLGWKR